MGTFESYLVALNLIEMTYNQQKASNASISTLYAYQWIFNQTYMIL